MKTYVLMVSIGFPKNHPRAGQPTGFVNKIIAGTKRHTIRANFELWEKRINEVNAGKAVLSLRYWSAKPYNSKQVEFLQLKQGEIGIQKLQQFEGKKMILVSPFLLKEYKLDFIAYNDSLSFEDFEACFANYDLSKPMAIIHFTDFRY